MNVIVGSKCLLDGDEHHEVIIVGPAAVEQTLEDQLSDADGIFSPFLPAISERVTVRHVQTGFEEQVEPHRLKQGVAASADRMDRAELQWTNTADPR